MLSKRINCLLVVDEANNLCGIITSTDFLKTLRSVQEASEKEVKFHLFFRCFLNRPERLQEIGGGYDTTEIIGFINHEKTVNSLRQHLFHGKRESTGYMPLVYTCCL